MLFMLGHSIKRLSREGVKSLSVPLIAFVLVILINVLGGIRAWLITQFNDTMNNYPIVAVLSDLTATEIDGLFIEMHYINLFFDPDVPFSLKRFTGELMMKRTLENLEISGKTGDVNVVGITNLKSDDLLNPEYGAKVTFYEGYDESIFLSNELVCVVSEDIYQFAEKGLLNVLFSLEMPDEVIPGEIVTTEAKLTVIGTVYGAGHGIIYSPFWAVSEIAEELAGVQPFAESLRVRLNNNRHLSEFKGNAAMSFSRARPIRDSRPHAMIVYDSEFYETLEPLRQNIIVVDVAIPFIYVLSIAVGFLTSVLLTRRRKAEFAIMRSVGINKWVVFMSALVEQALLSVAGAALGFAFVAVIWGYAIITRPAVFLACYLLGAVFAAAGAAGTNVMKVLRDRKE